MNAQAATTVAPAGTCFCDQEAEARQRNLLAALVRDLEADFGPVTLVETHISHIVLAGNWAWKIKKPVNPGFLDFTSLAARRYFCREELRLNRRLAPDMYLSVQAFCGDPKQPLLMPDCDEAFEYAVKMQRFPQACQADEMLRQGSLLPTHMDQLARIVADFHARVPCARPDEGHGTPVRIISPMERIFAQLWPSVQGGAEESLLHALAEWSRLLTVSSQAVMQQRLAQGFVRECHGDLHLGNIAMLPSGARIFDAIEFEPEFRWIDVQSEVAFLVMDCMARGRADLGARFLDQYLSVAGDYDGLVLWRWYAVYRALIRAMVAFMRAAQLESGPTSAEALKEDGLAHVRLAHELAHPEQPMLVIMHGYSGSGKSTLAQDLVQALPAVRVRSDVERQRLFSSLPSSDSALRYGEAADQATYAELRRLVRRVLSAGHHVVVDATCLRRRDRDGFRTLAQDMGVSWIILDCQTDMALLRQRICDRLTTGDDPSEATLEVLQAQIAHEDRLTADEDALVVLPGPDSLVEVLEVLKRMLKRRGEGTAI